MATKNQNIVAIRGRVKKTHKKARTVGFLYFIGTLVLILCSLLPCSTIQYENGSALSIANFFRPFLWVFDGDFSGIMVFFFYLTLLIFLIVKLIKVFPPYKRVLKKNHNNVNTCNRNVSAMEDLGEIFSYTFCCVLVIYSLMYVVTPDTGKIMVDRTALGFSMIGWIMLAVATLIHFIGGAIGCTSSLFFVSSYIEERKRVEGVWIFVLRSLIKIGFTALVACFILPICRIHTALPFIFDLDFAGLMPNGDIMPLLGVVLQIVIIVFLCNCIKHATSALEFNLLGMSAHGMTFFNKHILICGIISIVAFVLDKDWTAAEPSTITNYLFAGLIGIVGFILILLIKPKDYEELEAGRSWEDLKEAEKPQKKEVKKEEPEKKEAPAPVPVKAPLVYSQNKGGVNVPRTIDLRIVLPEADASAKTVEEAPMKWQVICPSCGKTLAVKQAPYHRCPVCGKVFRLNVGKLASNVAPTGEEFIEEMLETPSVQEPQPELTKKEQRKAKAAEKKAAKKEKKADKQKVEKVVKSKETKGKEEEVQQELPQPQQNFAPIDDVDEEFTITDTVIYE